MVERYAREKMSNNWTVEAKYNAWLKVEISAVKAWGELGLVPKEDVKKIVDNASFNIKEIEEIENVTKHDVIAFLTSLSNSLGDESRWVHYGMTSSDCIDTAVAIQIRDSLEIIIEDLEIFLDVLEVSANRYKDTFMVGRSHGIHGEPITFGLVVAIWYEEIKRNLLNIKQSLDVVSYGKISGAMGNFAHAPMELEKLVCDDLGLKPAPISNQIVQRDRYANMINALGLLASSCEKIAIAIRHYQRTEVYECEELFADGQKGSSAMPHKRNPVLTENVTGLCRVIRGYVVPAMENVALWHERDISHSSAERFILPDALITTDFMLNRLSGVIKNLVVYPKNMMKNINLTGGLVFSQRVLLELPLKGLSREESYSIVQKNAMRVWKDLQQGKNALNEKGESLYLEYLLSDEELCKKMSQDEIKECFKIDYYKKNIDNIFKRVFVNNNSNGV
jgi:adenylosuccinate lyase